jgi:hypothetical protein
MCKRLKFYLLLVCTWAVCTTFSVAQNVDDTAFRDTAQSLGVEGATPISGEYVPEHPVIRNSAVPTAADWKNKISDKAYSYRDRLEYSEKNQRPKDVPGWYKFLLSAIDFFMSPVGKFFLWSSLILIVGYVAYRIIKGQASGLFAAGDRSGDPANEALSEQGLLEADWESLLRQALSEGETRSAVRYAYLRLLQLLQEHGLIAYRPDKTNMDYYRELADKPQRQPFRNLTRQYEWAWYGQVLPDEAAMNGYLQTFHQLKQSIGSA